MKFSIERDELLKGLVLIQGVVEKRNTVPILSNVLLDAGDLKKLRIIATDLEVGITSLFLAKVVQPGKVTLNAKNLMEIARQLPSQEIKFQLLPNCDVEISCGKSLFKLHGLPADDFPALPEVEKQKVFSFPSEDLAEMIDCTAFSISTDETRFNLGGVYLEQIEGGTLRMVSSDGHRLSLIDRKVGSTDLHLKNGVIIPRKGLMEIRKLCAEVKGDLDFALAKANCVVQHADTTLVIRLIDGEFPEYRQVLPSEENQKKVTINREVFLGALRRISILSQEKTRGVRFQFEKNLLKVTVNNPDMGEAEEELEVQYNYPPLEIGFNAKYFVDALNVMEGEQIELMLSDGMSQGLLKLQGDESFKAVVMPMKLL